MLDARTASHAPRSASAGRQRAESSEFARNSEGRMVIREEDVKKGVQMDLWHCTGLEPCRLSHFLTLRCVSATPQVILGPQVQSQRGDRVVVLMIEPAMIVISTTCGRLEASGEACRAQAPNQ